MMQVVRIVLSFALLLSSSVSLAQSSFAKEMQMMRDGEKQKAFIEKVAQQAKDKDTASILSEMEPSMLKTLGEARILESLQSTVFPFFSTYVRLHNYEQITNAGLPDGRSGLWHYTYITSTTEQMAPFRIAVIDTSEGAKILDIVVNECVKGRHPICK